MPTSDPQEVHLGGPNYAAWDGRRVVLSARHNVEAWHSVSLEPEELGRFMDWLHDLIQSNPEGKVFTRSDAP